MPWICDESDVVEYRDMVWIVRDRISDLMKKGMTLAQIKAAKPTRDYDAEYDSPAVPADAFVESVFATLAPATPAPPAKPRGTRK